MMAPTAQVSVFHETWYCVVSYLCTHNKTVETGDLMAIEQRAIAIAERQGVTPLFEDHGHGPVPHLPLQIWVFAAREPK